MTFNNPVGGTPKTKDATAKVSIEINQPIPNNDAFGAVALFPLPLGARSLGDIAGKELEHVINEAIGSATGAEGNPLSINANEVLTAINAVKAVAPPSLASFAHAFPKASFPLFTVE
jgi:hypothetical protein